MENITIRQLAPDDLEAFRQLRLEALRLHPDAYSSTYEDWVQLSDDEWREKMQVPLFAAFDGDTPVGVTGLWPQNGMRTAHRALVVMVYVQSAMRGKSVAQLLFKAVEDYARGNNITQLELNVLADNQAAYKFYLREGYTEFGRRPNCLNLDGKMYEEVLMLKPVAPAA